MPKKPTAPELIQQAGTLLMQALVQVGTLDNHKEATPALRTALFQTTIAHLWLIAPEEMRKAEPNERPTPPPHSINGGPPLPNRNGALPSKDRIA